jgi:tetratricopeptide (TPR) repeat protein
MTLRRIISIAAMFLAIAFLACITLAQPSKKDIKKSNQLVQQAEKAFNQKNYRNAIDQYAQAIVLVPSNAKAHFWKGYSHFNLQEYDQAITELTTALDQGYTPPLDVYKVRGYAYYLRKNYDAAYTDIKQGLQLDPNNVDFLRWYGEISFAKASYPEALAAFQKVLIQTPNDPELYYSIAQTQFRLGNTDGQATAAEEAVKRNTRNLALANFLLGDAYQKQKKNSAAIDAYSKSIEQKPDLYEGYIQLADVYRAESRFNDAIDISKKALRVFPSNGAIYTNLSWYYSLAGRNDEAVQAAQAGVKLVPNQSLPYTNLCRAYNDTKQYVMAITACNSALKISPNDGETLFYLGRSYELTDKKAEAAKSYDRAVTGLEAFTRSNPDYSDGYYLLGNAYYSDNQEEKAIAAYTKCLQLSPRFPRARYNLGIVYVLKRNKASAMEQYSSLLSLDPNLAVKLKAEIDKL